MPGLDVSLLFGPMLIGVVLNTMLYGVMSVQMLAYYQRFTHDSRWIRYFMLYLFLVETVGVIVELGIIYDPLIIQYGQEAAILISPKLLPGDSLVIAIVSSPIQMFAAWRISVITGSRIFPGIIFLLSLGSFGAGVTMSIVVGLNPDFQDFANFEWVVTLWLILSAVCDIVIAVGMSYALYMRKTGFSAVDGQINRIIRLTVETGSLTAVTALVDVILFLGFPKTAMNFIVDFPLSNLYTCSMLAMLNSREQRPSDSERTRSGPQVLVHPQTTLILGPTSYHSSKSLHSSKDTPTEIV
ncbi:hypothetical protein K438DRAFT_348102 [Mycena galopus ATCC 62051]|nr:hypothetical protein K438DRAFT_348102 [Mycena galopus ATCC 62051]